MKNNHNHLSCSLYLITWYKSVNKTLRLEGNVPQKDNHIFSNVIIFQFFHVFCNMVISFLLLRK